MMCEALVNIGALKNISEKKFRENLFSGFMYAFLFRDSTGEAVITKIGKKHHFALALFLILISICLVLAVDGIAHLADYDGSSISALYALIPFVGYYLGGMSYDMIYTQQNYTKKNPKGNQK